jgi:hypothetical protein
VCRGSPKRIIDDIKLPKQVLETSEYDDDDFIPFECMAYSPSEVKKLKLAPFTPTSPTEKQITVSTLPIAKKSE